MSEEIQQHRDATLRRIGRNVVNFQRLEVVLRALVLATSAEGTLGDFQVRLAARAKSIKKSALGDLANDFNKNVYGPGCLEKPHESSSDGWLSFSFQVEADPVVAKEKKHALLSLVRERNRLIHSDLASLDLNSIESCNAVCETLDAQNERICRQLEDMKSIRNAHVEYTREFLAFVESDEFLKVLSGENGDA
jgi:hypothetical protein